jgi:transposase
MDRFPDSIRTAVNDLIRSGVTVKEIEEQFGLGHGTVYRWLNKLRASGEDVAFLKPSDRLRDKVFARFEQGASVQAVFEEFTVSRATLYRLRDEFERHSGSAPAPTSGRKIPAAGKDEPSGVARRRLAEAPKDVLIKQLKTALAEKTLEVDFFRGALREVEARRQKHIRSGEKRSIRG